MSVHSLQGLTAKRDETWLWGAPLAVILAMTLMYPTTAPCAAWLSRKHHPISGGLCGLQIMCSDDNTSPSNTSSWLHQHLLHTAPEAPD
jgi:hypothetical protein